MHLSNLCHLQNAIYMLATTQLLLLSTARVNYRTVNDKYFVKQYFLYFRHNDILTKVLDEIFVQVLYYSCQRHIFMILV
jgi:hypothetical protein